MCLLGPDVLNPFPGSERMTREVKAQLGGGKTDHNAR